MPEKEELMSQGMLQKALYSAVTAAALVFGASQAFATPQAVAGPECDNTYFQQYCRNQCQQQGYDTGTCDREFPSYCHCWYY
jgi:hypothetical protein